MLVPPWDVSYDVWAMGPPLDLIDKNKMMHVCVAVSIPSAHLDSAFVGQGRDLLRIDSTGNIQCYHGIPQSCIVGWREYMGNGRWVTMEFQGNCGLARLTLEEPYHAVPYQEPYSWLRREQM
eukprot:7646349-Alexandrium_andersonii.AAC.1